MARRGQTHPVIHFRFNELRTESVEAFEANLTEYVKGRLAEAGYAYDAAKSYPLNFANAIEFLHAKSVEDHKADPEGKDEGVVILIDEYDAPVGHALDDIPKAEAIRACGPRISARRWADGRPIWLIGLSFDSRTRHLVECAAEKF